MASPSASDCVCPCCRKPVVTKCGSILVHHFAHKSLIDCDSWSEGESEWHAGWKEMWPEECREVVVGRHRADIRTTSGLVIELQHSAISPEEIEERETFYGENCAGMVWLFDVSEAVDNIHLKDTGASTNFRWSRARRSIASCKSPVYWDFGDGLVYEVRKMHNKRREAAEMVDIPGVGWVESAWEPFAGWGYRMSDADFLRRFAPCTTAKDADAPATLF